MAQAIQFVMRSYECSELLLVSRQFDKLKVYFSHLVDTLNYLTNAEVSFAQLLPADAASQLVEVNKLSAPYIFQILRCSLPPIYKQTQESFKQVAKQFWSILEANLQ